MVDAEYRIEPHTNSGIALRGRYEVQIADDADRPASNRSTGAILGRIAPTLNAEKSGRRMADAGDSPGGPRSHGGV